MTFSFPLPDLATCLPLCPFHLLPSSYRERTVHAPMDPSTVTCSRTLFPSYPHPLLLTEFSLYSHQHTKALSLKMQTRQSFLWLSLSFQLPPHYRKKSLKELSRPAFLPPSCLFPILSLTHLNIACKGLLA